MSKPTVDEASALAALEWALYHKLHVVVVGNHAQVSESNANLDGKVKFFLTRTMANELNYADASSFDAILIHLKNLESKSPSSIDVYEFIYWKKEIFLQGALSILFRQLLPDAVPGTPNGEDRIPWKKPDDIQIPEQFNVNSFLQAIKDYFDAHSDLYQTTSAEKAEGDAEGILNQDLNEFGKDLTKVENRKKVLSKQKVFMLFKNRSWESRLSSFLDFFSKLETELYSTQPYLLLANKSGQVLSPAPVAATPKKPRKPRQPKEKKVATTISKPEVAEGEEKTDSAPPAAEEGEKPAKKQKTNYPEDYDTSDSDNQPDEVTNALLNLKNISKKRKASQAGLTSPAKAGSGLGEDGELIAKKPQGTRKKWTPSEDSALTDGLSKYGEGCWKQILEDPEFSPFLQGRTNINLKDRYRNLLKKGYKIGEKFVAMEVEGEGEGEAPTQAEAEAEC